MTTRLERKRQQLKAKLSNRPSELDGPTKLLLPSFAPIQSKLGHVLMIPLGAAKDLNTWNTHYLLQTLSNPVMSYGRRFTCLFNILSYLDAAFNEKKPLSLVDIYLREDGWCFDSTKAESQDWGGTDARVKTINKLCWEIYETNSLPIVYKFLQTDSMADALLAMRLLYNMVHFDSIWRLVLYKEPALISLLLPHLDEDVKIRAPAISLLHQYASHHSAHALLHKTRVVPALHKQLCPPSYYGVRRAEDVRVVTHDWCTSSSSPSKSSSSVLTGFRPSEKEISRFLCTLPELIQCDAFSLWIVMLLAMNPNVELAKNVLVLRDWIIEMFIASCKTRPTNKCTSTNNPIVVDWCVEFLNHMQSHQAHMVLVFAVEILHLFCRLEPQMVHDLSNWVDFRQSQVNLKRLAQERADPRLIHAADRLEKVILKGETLDLAREMPQYQILMSPTLIPCQRLCSESKCLNLRVRLHTCPECKVVAYCSYLCLKRDRNPHRLVCSALAIDGAFVNDLFLP